MSEEAGTAVRALELGAEGAHWRCQMHIIHEKLSADASTWNMPLHQTNFESNRVGGSCAWIMVQMVYVAAEQDPWTMTERAACCLRWFHLSSGNIYPSPAVCSGSGSQKNERYICCSGRPRATVVPNSGVLKPLRCHKSGCCVLGVGAHASS